MRGPGLSDAVSDTDPLRDQLPQRKARALDESPEASHTASVVNELASVFTSILRVPSTCPHPLRPLLLAAPGPYSSTCHGGLSSASKAIVTIDRDRGKKWKMKIKNKGEKTPPRQHRLAPDIPSAAGKSRISAEFVLGEGCWLTMGRQLGMMSNERRTWEARSKPKDASVARVGALLGGRQVGCISTHHRHVEHFP